MNLLNIATTTETKLLYHKKLIGTLPFVGKVVRLLFGTVKHDHLSILMV